MSNKTKKVASLSGSLLVQETPDPSVGFVLTSLDEAKQKRAGVPGQRADTRGKRAGAKGTKPAPPPDAIRPRESARPARPEPVPTGQSSDVANQAEQRPPPPSEPEPELRFRFDGEMAGPSAERSAESPADPGRQHLLVSLREGNLSRAESIFGHLTDLDPTRAKRVLYGPGGRNLALACRALGFEQLQFVSILILTRKLGPRGASLDPYQLTDLVNYFLALDEGTSAKVLKQWQAESVEMFGERS